jgi:hypothetical protein
LLATPSDSQPGFLVAIMAAINARDLDILGFVNAGMRAGRGVPGAL